MKGVRVRILRKEAAVLIVAALLPLIGMQVGAQEPGSKELVEPITIVDYSGFPEGWKIRGSEEEAREAYQVKQEGGRVILSAKISEKSIRIFKKVSWDPYTHPILTWRWRVLKWPEEPGASVDVYVSLDRDLLGIPTFVKYLWSDHLPVGTEKSGGFFSPSEVVIRSGGEFPGKWVTEEINVLEDFRRIYRGDPNQEAYGVGFLVSPGMEMELSEVVVLPRDEALTAGPEDTESRSPGDR